MRIADCYWLWRAMRRSKHALERQHESLLNLPGPPPGGGWAQNCLGHCGSCVSVQGNMRTCDMCPVLLVKVSRSFWPFATLFSSCYLHFLEFILHWHGQMVNEVESKCYPKKSMWSRLTIWSMTWEGEKIESEVVGKNTGWNRRFGVYLQMPIICTLLPYYELTVVCWSPKHVKRQLEFYNQTESRVRKILLCTETQTPWLPHGG